MLPSRITSAASLVPEEGDTRLRARSGLAIYFAVLVPLTAVFQVTIIRTGNFAWVGPLMWSPAVASVVARLALREGFSDATRAAGEEIGWRASSRAEGERERPAFAEATACQAN